MPPRIGRRAAREDLAFILEASTAITREPHYADCLQCLARLTVPALAPLCAVHVLEDGPDPADRRGRHRPGRRGICSPPPSIRDEVDAAVARVLASGITETDHTGRSPARLPEQPGRHRLRVRPAGHPRPHLRRHDPAGHRPPPGPPRHRPRRGAGPPGRLQRRQRPPVQRPRPARPRPPGRPAAARAARRSPAPIWRRPTTPPAKGSRSAATSTTSSRSRTTAGRS